MTTWKIDPSHSQVSFVVRHLMFSKVRGTFSDLSGTVEVDDADRSKSRVHVEIGAASVSSNDAKRDEHVRGADFFDVDKHPKIIFDSTSVTIEGGKVTALAGTLTIRGVQKPVTLAVDELGTAKDPWGGTRALFSARAKIDRTAFGLVWNMPLDTGGILVGEQVELEIDLQAVQS